MAEQATAQTKARAKQKSNSLPLPKAESVGELDKIVRSRLAAFGNKFHGPMKAAMDRELMLRDTYQEGLTPRQENLKKTLLPELKAALGIPRESAVKVQLFSMNAEVFAWVVDVEKNRAIANFGFPPRGDGLSFGPDDLRNKRYALNIEGMKEAKSGLLGKGVPEKGMILDGVYIPAR